jgi:hypothetical protein
MIQGIFAGSCLLAAAVAVVSCVAPSSDADIETDVTALALTSHDRRDLAAARRASARYHRVEQAIADGYVPTDECVESPDGGMGYHYIHPLLIAEPPDPAKPQALVYAPSPSGRLRLAAVEYFVFVFEGGAPWFGPGAPPSSPSTPHLFGQPFDGPMEGHGPGMPWHFDLHVWLWKHNPAGLFEAWNPNVSCPAH